MPQAPPEEDGKYGAGRTDAVPHVRGISEFLELLQHLFALGYGPGLVNLRVPDISLRVQHKRGALVHAPFLVENTVGFARRTVRPIVREQREGNAAQFLGPRLETGRGVGADIQDLAVQLLEFFVVRTEPVDLVRSPAGKRERHECDHDWPAFEARKRYLLVGVRRKREIGRCTTCFRFQGGTPSCMSRQSRHRRIPARRAVGNSTHRPCKLSCLHQPLTPAIIPPTNAGAPASAPHYGRASVTAEILFPLP
jgi:hypothetical protein